jgi:hypothetical protein
MHAYALLKGHLVRVDPYKPTVRFDGIAGVGVRTKFIRAVLQRVPDGQEVLVAIPWTGRAPTRPVGRWWRRGPYGPHIGIAVTNNYVVGVERSAWTGLLQEEALCVLRSEVSATWEPHVYFQHRLWRGVLTLSIRGVVYECEIAEDRPDIPDLLRLLNVPT